MRYFALTLAGAAVATIAAMSSASAQTSPSDCVNGYRDSGGITIACHEGMGVLPGAFPGRPPLHEPLTTGSIRTYDEPATTGSIRHYNEPVAPVRHRMVGSYSECAPGNYWEMNNWDGATPLACR